MNITSSDKTGDYRISVVIPAYNIEHYIERAINSVLAQTHQPEEIIVVDDGSTDTTADRIKGYGDKVRYIYQDNKGLSGARNTGIKEARFNWIALLDGDDEWLSEYLAMQIDILEKNSDLRWSSGNYLCCLCDENRRGPFADPIVLKKQMKGQDYFLSYFDAISHRACGHPDTMVIHKQVFETVGLFNEDQAFAEDLEMWWRITFEFPKIGYVTAPCAIYHMQRPGTLTEEFKKIKLQWLVDLVEKNLKMAAEKRLEDEFELLVGRMVHSWIRSMLFENRPQEIKELLARFDQHLSCPFKMLIRSLMIWPKATAWACHLISKIVRRFKLRRKIVRPPS